MLPVLSAIVLSVDELALVLSLLDHAAIGQKVISDNYPYLRQNEIEQRLLSAGHSLLSKRYCHLDDLGIAKLVPGIKEILAPVLQPKALLQIASTAAEREPDFINIYLTYQEFCTAHWIEMGVVHHFTSVVRDEGPDFILNQILGIQLTKSPVEKSLGGRKSAVRLDRLAQLQGISREAAVAELEAMGLNRQVADDLASAFAQSQVRGSVLFIKANVLQSPEPQLERAGPGLVFVAGPKATWIVDFEVLDEEVTGTL